MNTELTYYVSTTYGTSTVRVSDLDYSLLAEIVNPAGSMAMVIDS